jgi:CPA2 family monovalent cation:H+ antiporter-2
VTESTFLATIIIVVITLLVMVPFIWALAIRRIAREAYRNLWLNGKLNWGPLIAIELVRLAVAGLHVGFLMNLYFSLWVAFAIAVAAMALAILIFSHKLQLFYEKIEKRFLLNLKTRLRENSCRSWPCANGMVSMLLSSNAASFLSSSLTGTSECIRAIKLQS